MKEIGTTKARQGFEKWKKGRINVASLRRAYREKILDWVVKSMEFGKEPVSMGRLKELLKKEKAAPSH